MYRNHLKFNCNRKSTKVEIMSSINAQTDREIMKEASQEAADHRNEMTPENYFGTLPLSTGIIAGIVGALGIIVVIGILALATGRDPFLSARFIASIILGESAWATDGGASLAIIVGTTLHIIVGAIYGAVFAIVMPKMPRGFWFVAGILYAVLLWGISAVVLPLITPENQIDALAYTNAAITSHLVYGIILGIAGSFFGTVTSK